MSCCVDKASWITPNFRLENVKYVFQRANAKLYMNIEKELFWKLKYHLVAFSEVDKQQKMNYSIHIKTSRILKGMKMIQVWIIRQVYNALSSKAKLSARLFTICKEWKKEIGLITKTENFVRPKGFFTKTATRYSSHSYFILKMSLPSDM